MSQSKENNKVLYARAHPERPLEDGIATYERSIQYYISTINNYQRDPYFNQTRERRAEYLLQSIAGVIQCRIKKILIDHAS